MFDENVTGIEFEDERHLSIVQCNPENEGGSNPASKVDAALHEVADRPLGAGEVAEIFGVNRNQPGKWFKEISEVYPWVQLKAGNRYSLECVKLMRQLTEATQVEGLTYDQWKERVRASDEYQTWLQQSQPSAARSHPVVEAELENESTALTVGSRGDITSQTSTRQVQPLLQISIESLQIQLPKADVSGLNADTEKLQGINQQAVQVLTQYVSADLQSKVTELLSQNSNLAAAIQTAATVEAVKDLQSPKSPVAG